MTRRSKEAVYSVQQGVFGRFIITHAEHPGLAWSGSAWVQHCDGLPAVGIQLCNFDSEEDADDYATEHYLYPRRD